MNILIHTYMIVFTLISLSSQNIPKKYTNIMEHWKDEDYIQVYSVNKTWVFQVKEKNKLQQ